MGRRAPVLELERVPRADIEADLGSEDGGVLGDGRPVSKDEEVEEGHSGIGPENGRTPRSEKSWLDGRIGLDKEGSDNGSEGESEYSKCNSTITVDTDKDEDRGLYASQSGFTPLPLNQENIAVGLSWLWRTSAFSDLTISCNTYSFPVHKCILAAQRRYFNNMIRKTWQPRVHC
jgi:hypothetical protein